MKQSNRVKTAVRGGGKAYGYGLSFRSPWMIDILAKIDFDYVFMDLYGVGSDDSRKASAIRASRTIPSSRRCRKSRVASARPAARCKPT
jgi:2-keto-3-deoxy-L-rhamnonate aldolase RhmA